MREAYDFFELRELQWNLPKRPLLLSDHLSTKIPIGSSVSQIAIQWNLP